MRPFAFLIPALTLLAVGGWSSPALAQADAWVQCVARSVSSGSLYLGEPSDGAERGKMAVYRAEFIKAGQAAGAADGELNARTAFCFFAPRQADLTRMVVDLGKPCPSCSAPYRQAPVAWNHRDILPVEIAASASHLAPLVMSETQPPAAPAPGEVAPPPAPEPKVLASVRWQAFLCGIEVKLSYAFEAPADSPVEQAPFKGVVAAGGEIERPFDETLVKSSGAPPSCASATFLKVATLAEFSKDLPQRGDARLTALRKRLDDLTVQIAAPPAPALAGASPPPPRAKDVATKTPAATPAAGVSTPSPPAAAAVQAAAPPTPVARATADRRPAPSSSDDSASALLNADVTKRNAEIEARNGAAAADHEKRMAAHKTVQDAFEASQAAYQRSLKEHDAQVAEAVRNKADWEAKVKACKAGERSACAE